jgi:hypothetical protein
MRELNACLCGYASAGSALTSSRMNFSFCSTARLLRTLLVSIDRSDKVKRVLRVVTSKWSNRAWDGFTRTDLTTILQRNGGLSDHDLENLEDDIARFDVFVVAMPDALNSNFYHWTDRLCEEIRRGDSLEVVHTHRIHSDISNETQSMDDT